MLDFEQYIDMFLDESKDHLQNLNHILLDFEKDMENLETINEIFRIMHTLKGMSATMGFEKIAGLTHKIENTLDEIRTGKSKATPKIVDMLFKSLDALEGLVKGIEEDGKEKDIDVEEIIRLLQEDTEDDKTVSAEEAEEEGLYDTDDMKYLAETIEKAKSQGMDAFEVDVKLEATCVLKSARAFLIFRAIEENGEIIFARPSVEDIEDEKFDEGFKLITVTHVEREVLEASLKGISEIETVIVKDFEIGMLSSVEIADKKVEVTKEKPKEESKKEEKVETKPTAPATAAKPKAEAKGNDDEAGQKKGKTGKTVRVDIDRLDNLMNLVSELIIVKTRLEDHEISLQNPSLNDAVEYLERITTSLHDAVTKVRMVPIERVFNRFPRMVRDLSKELGKEIALTMKGEETEVDRTVIDEIGDPLIHLIRNSIDHGIETPEIRRNLGKSDIGNVVLAAYPDGNNVVIEVTDDGAGLNIDKIKKKAVEKGVISEEKANTIEDKDAAILIFAPGFSTADQVSDISGRGVGMDVVKTKIESLGGNVEIETERNAGSKFIIRLPLTLAILQALLVKVEEEKYAIPLNNIKEINDIRVEDIREVDGKRIILYRGNTLPLVSLKEVLDIGPFDSNREDVTVVIVKKGDKELGVMVDGLIGQQEIVIKSLGKYLGGVTFIAGATILGNGSVALIIDTNSLF